MKAAQYTKYGDASVTEINQDAVKPQLSADQIIVEVYAAGINPVEAAIRSGYMQQMMPLTFPINLGGDFSGVVSEVGATVTAFKVGDEVYGIANQFKGGSGAVAEYVSANAGNTGLKPATISHTEASALPLVGTSALQALQEHMQIKDGQRVLIHGGAGGIGSVAIQIAKALGAYVYTTASTDDVDFVKSLGADEVIDYKTQDFTTIVKDVDGVFDTAGGETTNTSLKVIREGGVLVTMSGEPDEALAKKHNITAVKQMTKGDTQQLTTLKDLVEAAKLKPIIDTIFTLDQTKEAYDTLEKHPRGKVVIQIH